jgi:hypothetical protein
MSATVDSLRQVVADYDHTYQRAKDLNNWFLASFREQVYRYCIAADEIKNFDLSCTDYDSPNKLWTSVCWAIHNRHILPIYAEHYKFAISIDADQKICTILRKGSREKLLAILKRFDFEQYKDLPTEDVWILGN